MDAIYYVRKHKYLKIPKAVIFCDLSNAFDTIERNILLKKMENYGIRGLSIQIFKSYFKNRFQKVQVLLVNIILNVYTIPTSDCASISTGHWNHGTTKMLPTLPTSTSGFFANTSPQSNLQDYSTRVHLPCLKYPQTTRRQDDTVSTRWSRSHRTIQDHLDPIGLVDVISKDIPSPLATHNRIANTASHDNVGLISPISSSQIRQQIHQDIMDPGNLWSTAQQNFHWETTNKTLANLIKSEIYDETILHKEEELNKTSDSLLHNDIKISESSEGGPPMDAGDTSPGSNSDEVDTSPFSFLNVSIENINPLETTLEEHLFYSSLNLSRDDIFTLCNLLPPTLHPFPYDIFPQHLSAFPALNEDFYETEDISLYEEESRPSSNQHITNDKTTIKINKDTKLETVSSSQENKHSNNYKIDLLNDPENTTKLTNHESYSDNPINHGEYYQESQDSFSDQHLLPSFEEKRHHNSINFLLTDGDFQKSETLPEPLFSDSDSITFFKGSLMLDHKNNSFNVNTSDKSNSTDTSKLDQLQNIDHQEVNVNYKIENRNNEDLIKSLKHTDRQEQIIDILSQLNLLIENEDGKDYSNKGCNCSSNFNKNINDDIVQHENSEEIEDQNKFGCLRKVAKGVDIVKQMGECVVSKANFALRKLNMMADKFKGHEEDDLLL